MSKLLVSVFFVLAVGLQLYVSAQESGGVNTPCLGCLCEAVSNCNRSIGCAGDICGVFHLTWGFWADGGKPTLANESPEDQKAFANCANDAFCAARAVQGYMAKFEQDCNGDGRINCIDYATIHKFGGYGCKGARLPEAYEAKLTRCFNQLNVPL